MTSSHIRRYTELLEDVRFKFALPAPFSFFNVLYRMFRYMYRSVKTMVSSRLCKNNKVLDASDTVPEAKRNEGGINVGYTRSRIDQTDAQDARINRTCEPWDHDVYGRFMEFTVEGCRYKQAKQDKLSQLQDMVGAQSKIISELKKTVSKMRPSLTGRRR